MPLHPRASSPLLVVLLLCENHDNWSKYLEFPNYLIIKIVWKGIVYCSLGISERIRQNLSTVPWISLRTLTHLFDHKKIDEWKFTSLDTIKLIKYSLFPLHVCWPLKQLNTRVNITTNCQHFLLPNTPITTQYLHMSWFTSRTKREILSSLAPLVTISTSEQAQTPSAAEGWVAREKCGCPSHRHWALRLWNVDHSRVSEGDTLYKDYLRTVWRTQNQTKELGEHWVS